MTAKGRFAKSAAAPNADVRRIADQRTSPTSTVGGEYTLHRRGKRTLRQRKVKRRPGTTRHI